jgi:hypothetical protein
MDSIQVYQNHVFCFAPLVTKCFRNIMLFNSHLLRASGVEIFFRMRYRIINYLQLSGAYRN